jgi:hypothetical protein
LYWDEPKGAFTDLSLSQEARTVKSQLLQNVLIAAKEANIQHMVVVDDGSFLPQLKACGVPFTCIRTPQVLKDSKDFTFKDGIVDDVTIAPWDVGSDPTSTTATAVCREDLAALCVQCLLSLRWDESRQLSVSSNGPVKIPVVSVQVGRPVLRVDQKWCVNSSILEDKLSVLS